MLFVCEHCGRPRPGVQTRNDDVRPVGNPECGQCGRTDFRAVDPSDFPAVIPYADDASAAADEASRYGDTAVRYVDDALCYVDDALVRTDDLLRCSDELLRYADEVVSAALSLPPV